jgi:hypothetical protein
MDCGLIVEKGRGLNEKWLEYLIFELFSNRKWSWTQSMARWTTSGAGPRWTADSASAVAHRRTVGTVPWCAEPRRGCGKRGRGWQ